MKNQIFILVLINLLAAKSATSQSFQKSYQDISITKITRTLGNGSAFTADYNLTAPIDNSASMVICLDSLGNKIWDFGLDGPEDENFYDIDQNAQGNYIISGHSWNLTGVQKTVNFILSLDSNGTFLRQICLVDSNNFLNNKALSFLPDNSILNLGYSTNGPFLSKIDSSGNLIWSKTFGLIGFNNLLVSNSGEYLLAGNDVNTLSQTIIVKLDTSGAVIFGKYYAGLVSLRVADFIEFSNGDLGVLGTYQDSINQEHTSLLRTDSNGNLIWLKHFDSNSSQSLDGKSFCELNDQSILVVADFLDSSMNNNKYAALHLDSAANFIDGRLIESSSSAHTVNVIPMGNTGYTLAGNGDIFEDNLVINVEDPLNVPCSDPFIISLSDQICQIDTFSLVVNPGVNCVPCSWATSSRNVQATNACLNNSIQSINENSYNAYPNPFSNNVTVEFSREEYLKSVEIFNVLGVLIRKDILDKTFKSLVVNMEDITPGVYFLHLKTNDSDILVKNLIAIEH